MKPMKLMELMRLLDSGMVEELKMYYNGKKTVVNIHNIPKTMPDYEIHKLWNSEDGKGISVLLADNTEHYPIPTFIPPKLVKDKTYTDKGGNAPTVEERSYEQGFRDGYSQCITDNEERRENNRLFQKGGKEE